MATSDTGTRQAAGALDLSEERLRATMWSLAWPAMVEEIGLSLLGVVDMILVGRLIGKEAVAAVGLGTLLFWLPQAAGMAISVGATAVIARDVGAGERRGAVNQSLRNALAVAWVWGILAGAAMAILAGPAMRVMGAEPDVIPMGRHFMWAGAIGVGFQSILFTAGAAFRASGDTRTPMALTIMVNIINLLAAFTAITGLGLFPGLGVVGSGFGFTLANTVGALTALAILARGRGVLQYDMRQALRLTADGIWRILRVGLPGGMEQVQFQIAFMVYARIVSGLGTDAYAAHTVALRAEGLAMMPGWAFGIAATTLVGQCLGARRPATAERAARLAQFYAVAIMTGIGAVIFAFAPAVVRVFVAGSGSGQVVDIGAKLLRVFAFALPGLAISTALAGALRGAGDTRAVMVIFAASAWAVRIPIAFVLAIPLGFGAAGAWVGAVADNSTRAAAIWARFHHGRWKSIAV